MTPRIVLTPHHFYASLSVFSTEALFSNSGPRNSVHLTAPGEHSPRCFAVSAPDALQAFRGSFDIGISRPNAAMP